MKLPNRLKKIVTYKKFKQSFIPENTLSRIYLWYWYHFKLRNEHITYNFK